MECIRSLRGAIVLPKVKARTGANIPVGSSLAARRLGTPYTILATRWLFSVTH